MADRPKIVFPGGAIIPDWRIVTTPDANAALGALFDVFIGPKWGSLGAAGDKVHRAVLRSYAASGRAPSALKIADATGMALQEVAASLVSLAGCDLVVLDSAGGVVGAYPFTCHPGEHLVETGGITIGAMCAIDALGIGAMLGQPAIVRSACRYCGHPLVVELSDKGRELHRVDPAGIAIWSGLGYAAGCAASSLCTGQVFFCNTAHREAWCADRSGGRDGIRLSLAEALVVGRAIFEPMRPRPWPPSA